MSEQVDVRSLERERAAFSRRVSALRTARDRSPETAPAILDAAFAELSVAEREFEACRDALEAETTGSGRRRSPTGREQRLLRAAFQQLPVPCLLVDHEGAVWRANPSALDLLGAGADFVVGRTFAGFVDMTARAVFRSHLANVVHGGTASFIDCRLVLGARCEDVHLSISPVEVPGDQHPLVLVAVVAPIVATAEADETEFDEEMVVVAARRLDVMARMTRLLLDEDSLQEPVALHRAARLLAGEYAEWVVVDLVRDEGLRRAVV
ncbi:MAG: PAS domain-containing protein, partial [Streptosporangiaceae bacterium]